MTGVEIQALLDSGNREVYIPEGTHVVRDTLYVHSHTHIRAHDKAKVVFIPERPMNERDFLLSNSDTEDGNCDITVEGGIWDGGFGNRFNVKNPDIFAPDACSGSCLNFVNVKGLRLYDLTVANSVIYNIRLGRVRDFEIKDIRFFAEKLSYNQDGVHLSGYCHDGVIENIRAVSKGQTNDDLIAINADDSTQRLENRGLMTGPIENIVVRNVYAEDCHTAVRMSSITAPIRNITIENIYAGVRCYAVNMDALRYCRTPLVLEASAPNGVGVVENVTIKGMKTFFTENAFQDTALISVEQHCKNVVFEDFERVMEKDARREIPTLLARNLTRQKVSADGNIQLLTEKQQSCIINGNVSRIELDAIC